MARAWCPDALPDLVGTAWVRRGRRSGLGGGAPCFRVAVLEPTRACNIACIGCGKIREYESNRARLSVEECIDAGRQCPAPVVSICGGEPLIFKGIEDVVAGMLEMKKNIELCTNALRLQDFLDVFEPDLRLTFVVHLDGMREIHDYVCDYPGLWDIAVESIHAARAKGFRVTTN